MKNSNKEKKSLKPSIKQIMLGIGLSVIVIMLNGCGHASQGSFCNIYQPVYTSTADTEETKQQVDNNNVVWLELCDEAI